MLFLNGEVYSFENWQQVMKTQQLKLEEDEITDVREISGSTASPGQVTGIVRLILLKSQASELRDGEILVTEMTNPDYVPAMKRAAAIVTDEGGIMCHAAIVSRELDKPCVIGTKIATRVLKDGDEVEVDADNGVVKIVK